MRRFLVVIEVLLYLLFLADCMVLVAGVARVPSWEPVGGGSLIVLLLLAGIVRRIRDGPSYL